MLKKYRYQIIVSLLVALLCFVSFYMLFVHVPYYNHYHELDEIRNQICKDNQYQYLDYFYEYRGKEKYYILKVKKDGLISYVAYNKDLELRYSMDEIPVDKNVVLKNIKEKYNIEIEDVEIGYEDNQFVYFGKFQDDGSLMYVYYNAVTGQFLKAVTLMEN